MDPALNTEINSIQYLRKLRNMTQKELADVLGVHQTAISHWETGKTYPEIHQIIQLADLFNVSTDYLLGREQHTKTPEQPKAESFNQKSKLRKIPLGNSKVQRHRVVLDEKGRRGFFLVGKDGNSVFIHLTKENEVLLRKYLEDLRS